MTVRWHIRNRFQWATRQAFTTCQAIRVLEDDAPEPARKSCWFAQLCQSEIGLDKGFLRDIFSEMHVLNHGIRTSASHILKAFDDAIENFRVALLCSSHE